MKNAGPIFGLLLKNIVPSTFAVGSLVSFSEVILDKHSVAPKAWCQMRWKVFVNMIQINVKESTRALTPKGNFPNDTYSFLKRFEASTDDVRGVCDPKFSP